MQKREAAFQTRFNLWLKHVYLPQIEGPVSMACELKYTDEKSISFSAVAPHQQAALKAAAEWGLVYKIPDDSRSYKPFDSFCIRGSQAFIVLGFKNNFYLIRIDRWSDEEQTSTRRSITEERAGEIAQVKGTLGSKKLSTSIP